MQTKTQAGGDPTSISLHGYKSIYPTQIDEPFDKIYLWTWNQVCGNGRVMKVTHLYDGVLASNTLDLQMDRQRKAENREEYDPAPLLCYWTSAMKMRDAMMKKIENFTQSRGNRRIPSTPKEMKAPPRYALHRTPSGCQRVYIVILDRTSRPFGATHCLGMAGSTQY
jgi:hypothetical protein